jgi:hypothetical protein
VNPEAAGEGYWGLAEFLFWMAVGAAPLFALAASLAAGLLNHLEKHEYISKRQHAALRRRLGLSDDYPSPRT